MRQQIEHEKHAPNVEADCGNVLLGGSCSLVGTLEQILVLSFHEAANRISLSWKVVEIGCDDRQMVIGLELA